MDTELVEAAQNLVKKLKEIENDPGFNSMFMMAYVHGQEYTGPNWGAELETLEKVLEKISKVGTLGVDIEALEKKYRDIVDDERAES